MTHFIKIVQAYSTSNKLQHAVYSCLKEVEHTLLENTQLEDFIADLEKKVHSLCDEHPRCKPIHLRRYNLENGTAIYVENVIIIHIYKTLKVS